MTNQILPVKPNMAKTLIPGLMVFTLFLILGLSCGTSTPGTNVSVMISSTSSSPTKTSPIPMTATFSEPVTGLAVGDITIGNGTAGSFAAVSATVYTFNVTPASPGAVTVDIAAGVAQDAAGNNNSAAAQFSITYDNTADSTAPTVTLSSTSTSPTKTSPIPVTATFSEPVTGLAVGDITVGNGTAGSFVSVSATVYSFNVTPASPGAVTVDIAAGVALDAAGNNNSAAARFTITYEVTTTMVNISGFSFIPDTITVPVGTMVTWTNMDLESHTISSRDALFDSGSLSNGAAFNYTFEQSGTFEYYCKIHPFMTGRVIVQ